MPELELDEAAQKIMGYAIREAYRLQHPMVGSPHLFLALLQDSEGALPRALAQLGYSAEGVRILIRQAMRPGRPGEGVSAEVLSRTFSPTVQHALAAAAAAAQRAGATAVGEVHLVTGLAVAGLSGELGSVGALLRQIGLEPAALAAALGAGPAEGAPDGAGVAAAPGTFGPRAAPPPARSLFDSSGRLDLSRFDDAARQILARAAAEGAADRGGLSTIHLLLGLLGQPAGYTASLLSQQGHDAALLAEALRRASLGASAAAGPAAPRAAPQILSAGCTVRLHRILSGAEQLAAQQGERLIGERHLLAAFLVDGGGSSAELLAQQGVNWSEVAAAVGGLAGAAPQLSRTPLLSKLGRDLTRAAREGQLNPVIGREREIKQIVQILAKSTKNNPLLVGEAGVGKTAVVEGLAQRIAEGRVPPTLTGKRVIEITLAALLAGTRYRGDFEERLQRMVAEVRSNADVLLFIDEIHTLVGSGDAGGTLDAANILKPSLARGELHVIGATTPAEYQRTIAQDAALERRFQQVLIEEPTPEQTLEILERTRGRYEARFGVEVTRDALAAAVELSVRYLPDRRLPDKACDLVEEACARVSVGSVSDWGKPPADAAAARAAVDAAAVAQVVAELRGLPVEQLSASDQQRLLELEERLQARVIGQEAAVRAVARAVRVARTGLKDPGRPSGVFLFLGPTGVGKTELAKALARELFGSEDQLIRLDMSEFMEPHSVAKLIGAPPGYVGYREEGQLVRELRRKPYSVVLIDEIEKAATSIFDLFLQLFDEGRLTDAQGRQVDGRHAIYILTSNVGTELVGRPAMGFTGSQAGDETLQQELFSRLRQTFRPEFLNRIDETVIFQRLHPSQIRDIARLQIAALQGRAEAEHGVKLEITDEALDVICEQGFNEALGARPLKRAIAQLLAAPLSEMLLAHPGGQAAGGAAAARRPAVIVARAPAGRIVLEYAEQGS